MASEAIFGTLYRHPIHPTYKMVLFLCPEMALVASPLL